MPRLVSSAHCGHTLSPICSLARSLVLGMAALFIAEFANADEEAFAPLPDVPDAEAAAEADMQPYTEIIAGTSATFDMLPIPGGEFVMGSAEDEANRQDDEGPQHTVQVEPFWMGKHEVTWDEYEIWMFSLDVQRRQVTGEPRTEYDVLADTVTRCTKPYTDMTFGMGKAGYPAICMTQLAAKTYCRWLTAKTGRFYRLPTEAEWEYACRAGTTSAYSFGDDPDDLDDYGWYYDNSDDAYHKVGRKEPNPWGLYDMHGNVSEWVMDAYAEDGYTKRPADMPAGQWWLEPTSLYPRTVRGGSWDDDPDGLRSAGRRGSDSSWKAQDPQLPQSVWYHTDALFVGFRVVRPLHEPSDEEQARYWSVDEVPKDQRQ